MNRLKLHKRKRTKLAAAAAVLLLGTILAGCGTSDSLKLEEGKINVVASFYPLYYFTEQIGGEHVHAINLTPVDVEPHLWSPKSQDMKNLSKADLVIYNGLGFESWIEDFEHSLPSDAKVKLVEATHDIDVIKLSESAEKHADEEEKHADEEEEHEEEGHEEDAHGHGAYDPHAWLSPVQAGIMAANIRDALIEEDPSHREDYEANFTKLAEKLNELDSRIQAVVNLAERKEIVASHEAFAYLARDYQFTQRAVMGLSPDAEPKAGDIKEISDFIKEHQVKYILFEELVKPEIAQMLANDLDIETLVFNPLEGLTLEQEKAKEDYFTLMERNLTTLKKALQ